MGMRGCFVLRFGNRVERLWNTVPQEGQLAQLAALYQQNFADWPATLYMGLCDQPANNTLTLADITTEPTVLNGYARKALTRNSVDWPTLAPVNGFYSIRSKTLTFTATGGDFSSQFTRAFICTVASGNVGKLISISGALTEAVLLAGGDSFQAEYQLFLVAPV